MFFSNILGSSQFSKKGLGLWCFLWTYPTFYKHNSVEQLLVGIHHFWDKLLIILGSMLQAYRNQQGVSQALFDDVTSSSRSIWIYQLVQIVLSLLEKVFSFLKRRFLRYCTCMWYLIIFQFYHDLFLFYLLFSPYRSPYTQFFLKGFSL